MARRVVLLFGACLQALCWLQAASAEQEPLPAAPWQPGPQRYSVTVPEDDSGPTLSLYPQQGIVGVATGMALEKRLTDPNDGGQNWYFVELYDHMCPHCWYAVPIVTGVAGAFEGVQGFRTATVNCHIRSNAEACFMLEMVANARDYPTFLLCPPDDGHPVGTEHLDERGLKLLDNLRGKQLQTFRSLMRCRFRFVDKAAPHGQADPYLSAQQVAEWVVQQSHLEVQHPEELTHGADFADAKIPDPSSPPGRPGWLQDDEAKAPGVPAWVPGQRWFDALRGFIYLLRENYRAARHNETLLCTDFLARTFPVKGEQLHALGALLRHAGPQDTPDQFLAILAKWAKASDLPDPGDADQDETHKKYMTCDGSTCAMWTLLHVVLTAVAVRGITKAPLLGDGAVPSDLVGVSDTVGFVQTFVSTFLSCRRCKENFLEGWDGCSSGRCEGGKYRDMVLWLWRKHNAVSLDVAMRQHAEVDRRWPMFQDCPMCWRREFAIPEEANERRLRMKWSEDQLNAPFDTNRVFWHMVRTYVGLSRVRLEIGDLDEQEREEMQAVVHLDRQRETKAAAGRPHEHKGFVEEPPGSGLAGSHPVVLAVVFLVLGCGGLLAAYFCGTRLTSGPCPQPGMGPRQPDLRSAYDREYDDDELTSEATESVKGDAAAE